MTTKAQWIPVKSNSDVPDGLWLVKTKHGDPHIFNNGASHKKMRTIGHYFESDEEVVMYWNEQLPMPPETTPEA